MIVYSLKTTQNGDFIEEKRGKDGTLWRLYRDRLGYMVAVWVIKTARGEIWALERHGITLSQWAEI